VLEHFHRHDPVETTLVERQVVHVAGDDLDVAQVPAGGTRFDELFLRT
jgi:hypothetical protein